MGKEERHAYGAHYTNEAEIQKVVLPTVVRSFRERLDADLTAKELAQLRKELTSIQILDPACGSGNFLYIAYRELARLEMDLLESVYERFGGRVLRNFRAESGIRTTQFHGIDVVEFAV